MKSIACTSRPLLLVLMAASVSACTYGRVTNAGRPVGSAEVVFENCKGDTYTATADLCGGFAFNPYSPTSNDVDPSKAIPEGHQLVTIWDGRQSRQIAVEHSYSDHCRIQYDGVEQDVLCKGYAFDMSKMDFSTRTGDSFWRNTCHKQPPLALPHLPSLPPAPGTDPGCGAY